MCRRKVTSLLAGCALACSTALAQAPELMVYPNEDQDKEQQEQDEFQCYRWAKDESGFDPMEVPTATEAPPEKEAQKGGVGRGAARGAAVGLAVGRSSGAKKGAAAGALVGGMRRSDQVRQEGQSQAQWEQEQAQIYAQARNSYNRAYAACMEGRGYTVR